MVMTFLKIFNLWELGLCVWSTMHMINSNSKITQFIYLTLIIDNDDDWNILLYVYSLLYEYQETDCLMFCPWNYLKQFLLKKIKLG